VPSSGAQPSGSPVWCRPGRVPQEPGLLLFAFPLQLLSPPQHLRLHLRRLRHPLPLPAPTPAHQQKPGDSSAAVSRDPPVRLRGSTRAPETAYTPRTGQAIEPNQRPHLTRVEARRVAASPRRCSPHATRVPRRLTTRGAASTLLLSRPPAALPPSPAPTARLRRRRRGIVDDPPLRLRSCEPSLGSAVVAA
jgi:hypothetical protein